MYGDIPTGTVGPSSGAMSAMSILPVVGSIISGAMQRSTAEDNTKRTIQANKELAEYQYSKDVEMWNRTNEYNSPSAQMQRLKDAGLNPNLVYGGGAGNLQAAQMPKYNAPTVEYKNVAGMESLPTALSQFQNFQLQRAQIDAIRAGIENTRARTANEFLRGALVDVQTRAGETGILQTKQGLERGAFELEQARALGPYSLDIKKSESRAASLAVQRAAQELALGSLRSGILSNELEASKYLPQKARTENELRAAELLKARFGNQLREAGVTENDWAVWRLMARYFTEAGFSIPDMFKSEETLKSEERKKYPHFNKKSFGLNRLDR